MKAILFDMDGTLCDTLPLCIHAFKGALEPMIGRALDEAEIFRTFGPSEEGVVRQLCPDHYEAGIQSYWDLYEAHHQAMCPAPFEGIPDILHDLSSRDIFVGLVTGKGPVSCTIDLRAFDIEHHFDVIKAGSPDKPVKTQQIREILHDHQIAPDDVIYVGDTVSDVHSCRAAGIPVYSALWGSITEEARILAAQPDGVFYRVEELRTFLDETLDKK